MTQGGLDKIVSVKASFSSALHAFHESSTVPLRLDEPLSEFFCADKGAQLFGFFPPEFGNFEIEKSKFRIIAVKKKVIFVRE